MEDANRRATAHGPRGVVGRSQGTGGWQKGTGRGGNLATQWEPELFETSSRDRWHISGAKGPQLQLSGAARLVALIGGQQEGPTPVTEELGPVTILYDQPGGLHIILACRPSLAGRSLISNAFRSVHF